MSLRHSKILRIINVKMMIFKRIAVILLCVLCVIQQSGCDDKGALVGTWELTAAAVDGESVNVDDVGVFEMQLNSDGSATLTTGDGTAQSTWSYDGGKLVIDGISCTFADDFITCNDSGMYLKFEKR